MYKHRDVCNNTMSLALSGCLSLLQHSQEGPRVSRIGELMCKAAQLAKTD